jgi:hypothetical protein
MAEIMYILTNLEDMILTKDGRISKKRYHKIIKPYIKSLEDRLEVAIKALELYADPERNEDEWLSDYGYYEPYPPCKEVAHCHGDKARKALKKIKELY